MTTTDRVTATIRTMADSILDKEPLNYFEAAALHGIILGGRQNIAALELFHNHAQDADLKKLLRLALEKQTVNLTEKAESMLKASAAHLPSIHFVRRNLLDSPPDIPVDIRMTDQEIVSALANMAKTSQMVVLAAMHQTYQPEVALVYRQILEEAFDFNYRLIQLALNKGWLPHVPKIEH